MADYDFENDWFQSWKYPGGEVGVRIRTGVTPPRSIVARMQNSDDVLRYLMVCDAVNNIRGTKFIGKPFDTVFIPYLPYARQDRIAVAGDPFAKRVLTSLVLPTANKILCADMHSDVQGEHLTSVWDPDPYYRFAEKFGIDEANTVYVVPDKGAVSKAVSRFNAPGTKFMFFDKVRDVVSGRITGIKQTLPKLELPEGNVKFVIIDDICDGGGTFHAIQAELENDYPGIPVYLFTTHGIYSAGLEKLTAAFAAVGCTNSFLSTAFTAKLPPANFYVDFTYGMSYSSL